MNCALRDEILYDSCSQPRDKRKTLVYGPLPNRKGRVRQRMPQSKSREDAGTRTTPSGVERATEPRGDQFKDTGREREREQRWLPRSLLFQGLQFSRPEAS